MTKIKILHKVDEFWPICGVSPSINTRIKWDKVTCKNCLKKKRKFKRKKISVTLCIECSLNLRLPKRDICSTCNWDEEHTGHKGICY